MTIKWLKHGKNEVDHAIRYILKELNHKKEKRDEVILLRGDPQLLKTLGKVLKAEKRKNIYSSCVIGFHPKDQSKLNLKTLNEILIEFEKCMSAYAGVTPDRIPYIAVYHREGNNSHIHVIVLRMDLETGKSINPAPPGWEKLYGLFRRYIELKYGFVNPDERKRPVTALPEHVERSKWFQYRERIKEEITKYVLTRLADYSGVVEVTRQTILEILSELGEVVAVGKDFINLKIGDAIFKLKGGLYDEEVGRYLQEVTGRTQAKDRNQRRAHEEVKQLFYSELRRVFAKTSKRFGGADEELFLELGEATGRTNESTARRNLEEIPNGTNKPAGANLTATNRRHPEVCWTAGEKPKKANKRAYDGNLEINEGRTDKGRTTFATDSGLASRSNNRSGYNFAPEIG